MNEAPAEAPSAAAKEDDSASMSLDPNDEGPQLALAYRAWGTPPPPFLSAATSVTALSRVTILSRIHVGAALVNSRQLWQGFRLNLSSMFDHVPASLVTASCSCLTLSLVDIYNSGSSLIFSIDPVDWEAKIADPVLVDDSLDSVVPSRETQSKFYHEALKSKYHLLEWRGIKPLDIFLKEAIYSLQDQENILRLWLGYGENADSLRRGEELFYFLCAFPVSILSFIVNFHSLRDEEDVGTSVFEKFVSFHMTVADQNHFGEINFAEFVRMYQLLAVSYQTKVLLLP